MKQIGNKLKDDPDDIRFVFTKKFREDFTNFRENQNEIWEKDMIKEKDCFENKNSLKSNDSFTNSDIGDDNHDDHDNTLNNINKDNQPDQKISSLLNDSKMTNNSCEISIKGIYCF